MKRAFSYYATAPIRAALPILAGISFLLTLILEILGRRSFLEAFAYLCQEPIFFLINVLIVLFTLSLCLLVRRRIALFVFLCSIWFALGVTNFIVLSYRSSPLSAIDFLILKAALGMFTVYFTVIQAILIAILAAALIATLVLLFLKAPRCRVSYRKSISCIVIIGLSLGGLTLFTTRASAAEKETIPLSDAYEDYGFAYCFAKSLLSQGVERPEAYSETVLHELVDTLRSDAEPCEDVDETIMPNVIFVQLESFCDISYIKKLTCSENPTPNFTALKEESLSGALKVKHVGGGTANVEFEVLTGMNLEHFGFGEYPYTTILKEQSCESLASNLKRLGYHTHAIHNHTATFYDRHLVYPHLGFDTFTPIESMTGVTRNPLGWAKDAILTEEILAALASTDGADFVFAVSVQGHGKYPEESLQSGGIEVYGVEDEYSEYHYYVNQLHEMDAFIGELIDALEASEEPCLVVFYGDHMPALNLTDADVTNGDLYETEYAVWSNFPLAGEDRDLKAYQLSAYIQGLLGMQIGDITLLHQSALSDKLTDEERYEESLTILEYAMLYDRENRGDTPTIQYGVQPLTVDHTTLRGNTLYLFGSGFNEYSCVKINSFLRDTLLIDENTLAVENIFFSVDTIEVVQITDDGTELYGIELSSVYE